MVKNGCRSEKLTTLAATGRGSVPIQISVTVGGFKEAEGGEKKDPTPPAPPHFTRRQQKRGNFQAILIKTVGMKRGNRLMMLGTKKEEHFIECLKILLNCFKCLHTGWSFCLAPPRCQRGMNHTEMVTSDQ